MTTKQKLSALIALVFGTIIIVAMIPSNEQLTLTTEPVTVDVTYPQDLRDAYMYGCLDDTMSNYDTCVCMFTYIEQNYTVEEVLSMDERAQTKASLLSAVECTE
jgi:hypothetical protein